MIKMPTTYIQPLDFKTVLINYFLGTQELFIFAFVIIFSYVAAKYQMSNMIYGVLLVLGSIMFAAYLGEAIYFLILVFIGFIAFKIIGKIVT